MPGPRSGSWSSSWLEPRETLVGVEDPRLDEVALVGLATERLHGAREHVPVEHLLLARRLDVRQRPRPPGVVVAAPERLTEAPIGPDVGGELMVLVGEGGAAPAPRRGARRPPRRAARAAAAPASMHGLGDGEGGSSSDSARGVTRLAR